MVSGNSKSVGGVSKATVFKGKYEAKPEFPKGLGGGSNQQTIHGGNINIFSPPLLG